MDGKLYKEGDYYVLEKIHPKIGKMIIASSDHDLRSLLHPNKLSLNNCQAIANGYDLEVLATESANTCEDSDVAVFWGGHYDGFKKGAKAILEILGDKKFSEEDIKEAFHQNPSQTNKPFKEFIQSLQQTEWQVEIETEQMNLDEIREQGKGFLDSSTTKFKLDSTGCLILKRK